MTENAAPLVRLDVADTVATVTLDRPQKMNALTPQMIEDLLRIADEIEVDSTIRCVILTASGEKAFCVGADINEWAALEPLDMWRRWIRRGHQVFDRWARLRVPVIAAINGHALGGGLELAAVADIRIACAQATFALPEASIATCPGWSGTQRLAALVGASRVKYLALTGIRIDAREAWRLGVVHEYLDDVARVRSRASEIAAGICKLAPISTQLTKQIIDAGEGAGLAGALEMMAGALAATTEDAREGIASFQQKRAPSYRGK